MHLIILELGLLIFIASVLAFLARLIKQPIILAYIAAGALVAYFGLFEIRDRDTFQVFADLGIMFLLFLIGLEINLKSLKVSGKASIIVGLGQIIFTFIGGFLITLFLGFDYLPAIYIAIALTFSSTIIIVKLLSDKKKLNSLYGRISIGFLLVQDFVAILILIFLAGIGVGSGAVLTEVLFAILKGIALFVVIIWLSKFVFPSFLDKVAISQEFLFLVSLAWVFIVAIVVDKMGFSIEIAGFLAGVALANSSENLQIASRIRPLRDFFILVFFFILGSLFVFSDFSNLTLPIIILSLFVLIGNPLIVLAIMGIMGHRKRTSFLAGVTVAQISEFSLIIAALGFKLGHISGSVLGLITAVGVITIVISTYIITNAEKIYPYIVKLLSVFERRKIRERPALKEKLKKPIVLIGCHRTGQSIAFNLPKEKLLVVDFDPEIIKKLKRHGFDYIFGDIRDPEIFEAANLDSAELVISTSPDIEDNLTLISEIKLLSKKPRVILRAENEIEAKAFYEAGADYVLQPHFASGQYLGKMLSQDSGLTFLDQLREKDQLLEQNIITSIS